jgi:hypothetical protein
MRTSTVTSESSAVRTAIPDGSLFEGSDEEYAAYLQTVLPTAEDEEALKEIFKQQWVEDKPLTPRQLASGIGATA